MFFNKSYIFIVQLDATSFFHDFSYGADNDATGVITLLAAAQALGRLKREVSFVALITFVFFLECLCFELVVKTLCDYMIRFLRLVLL